MTDYMDRMENCPSCNKERWTGEMHVCTKQIPESYDLFKNDPHILLHWLDAFQIQIYKENKKWWFDKDGNRLERNKGEMLALIHSEISECLEGVRKSINDNHLSQYSMEIVELADAIIRIFDYAEGHKLGSLGPVIINKIIYNRQRLDHKTEEREKTNGKKF